MRRSITLAMAVAQLLLACNVVPAQSTSGAVAEAWSASVSGRVRYRDGTPVANALVATRIFAAYGGILPLPVHTASDGSYRLIYPPLGGGYISASKVAEGYADFTLSLYGKRDALSLKLIELKPKTHLEKVDLILDRPLPRVVFKVEKARSGTVALNAGLLVRWSDDPNIMISSTIPASGVVALLLPEHAIDLTISAPGYHNWEWHASPAQPGVGGVQQESTVVASLVPLGK